MHFLEFVCFTSVKTTGYLYEIFCVSNFALFYIPWNTTL